MAAFAVFFAIWFIAPAPMGMGDVRLAGVIGVGLGWIGYRQLYLGFLVAFIVGVVIGVVKMAGAGERPQDVAALRAGLGRGGGGRRAVGDLASGQPLVPHRRGR